MKNLFSNISIVVFLLVFLSCSKQEQKNYIQYVDPLIGTAEATTISAQEIGGDHVGHGQTIPAVTAPFGMTQWVPQVHDSEKKCLAPYYFGTTSFQGFRATHWLSGSCVQDYGSFTVFPAAGTDDFQPLPNQRFPMQMLNSDDLSPAYLSVMFPESQIMTEITATKRCGFFRFSWVDAQNPTVFIDVNSDENQGYIKIDTVNQEISGYNPVHRIYNGSGKPAGISGYFVARFDKKFTTFGTYGGFDYERGSSEKKDLEKLGGWVSFVLKGNEPVKMKMGTSFTSIENARKNLEAELPGWDFEKTKETLEKTWNEMLGKIDVESTDEKELTKFYTSLYHAFFHPRLYSDVNGDYPEFSKSYSIKNTGGHEYYDDFSNWDIYRAQMPLLSLVAPAEYTDMVKSLILKAEQGGWLPIFPMWNSYTSAMIGDHSTSIIADAYAKGFEFDFEKAYFYMRKNAFETPEEEEYIDGKGRRALASYVNLGYIPLEDDVNFAFHKREQVSRTLEYAYNDWCVAQVAKGLGKTDDYNQLSVRAQNYTNVYDEEQGWMNGRYADGTFYPDFNPGEEAFFITEGTPKHYSWYVPHDVKGLVNLMGEQEFKQKLNDLIDQKQYWHGNEPSHQIPFLFNYTGQWDKTQQTIKHILKTEYDVGPGGISGNDDAGQMSAWYVFGAMGFYPLCPGNNEYELSSPSFKKVTLHLDKKYYPAGKFILETDSEDVAKIYNKVLLNGNEISPRFSHAEIQKGGKLSFISVE